MYNWCTAHHFWCIHFHLFNYLRNCKNDMKSVLDKKYVFQISPQLLFETIIPIIFYKFNPIDLNWSHFRHQLSHCTGNTQQYPTPINKLFSDSKLHVSYLNINECRLVSSLCPILTQTGIYSQDFNLPTEYQISTTPELLRS